MQLINIDIARNIVNNYTPIKAGSGRYIYQYGDCVIKAAELDLRQNLIEACIWEDYGETDIGGWLSPVVARTPCFRAIIMKMTTPIEYEELPHKVPQFLTDNKVENWGILEGVPVCHDYGTIKIDLSTELKQVNWNE